MAKEGERRTHLRFNVRWPITVLSEHGRTEGETRNISVSGMLIQCNEQLNQNEFLRLSLESPKKLPIWVSGTVVWSDSGRTSDAKTDYSMGFSFVEIADADRALLNDLVTGL